MKLLVIQAAMVFVIVAAVLVPGWSIAALVRVHRSTAPSELRRAWAVLYGMGWASIATALALLLGASRLLAAVLVLAPVLPAMLVALRAGALRPRMPQRSSMLLHGWAALVAALVGTWGATFRSDGTYHAAVVEKLARLDGMTQGTISPFPDGHPIPALLAPTWHQLLALAAQLPRVEYGGITALWSAAGAAAWLLVLVAAASGRVATGRYDGGWVAAIVTPIVLLAPLGGAAPLLQTLGFPGNVVLFVVLPAVLTTIAWRVGDEVEGPERTAWIAALVLGTCAVCAIHLTYAYYLAMLGIGMLGAAWLVGRSRAVQRLLLPAAVVAGTCLVAGVLQLPVLVGHPEFGRGVSGSEGALVRHTWSAVLADHGFAIRGSWLLAQGALFTIGMLAVVLVLPLVRRRRIEATLLVVVPVLVLGALARSGPAAELLAGIGSFPPVPRTPRMFPAALALVVVVCALDERFTMYRRRLGMVLGGCAAAVIAASAFAAPAGRIGEDLGEGHHGLLPSGVFDVLLIVLALELAFVAIRVRRSTPSAPPLRSARGSVSWGFGVVLGIVAVGAWGVAAMHELRERPAHITQAEGLADGDVLDRDWFSTMRQLQPRAVVLADPRVSLRVAAVAPVYVTSIAKNQLSTPEREQALLEFLDPATSDDDRLAYLKHQEVDAIVFPARQRFVRTTSTLLATHPGWHAYFTGDELRLYCIGSCTAIPAAWRQALRPVEPRHG